MPSLYIPGLATLRDYQKCATDKAVEAALDGYRPVVVAPTGSGKSMIASAIATTMYKKLRGRCRVVCIVPTRELALQNEAAHIRLDAPNKPSVGVFCAGLGRREVEADYVIATLNSFHTFIKNSGFSDDKPLILLFDEAHRVGWNERSMTRMIIKHTDPKHIIGLTATPYRGDDNRKLDQPSRGGTVQPVFNKLIQAVSAIELIRRGMLVPLRVDDTFARKTIDTTGVRTKNGEFVNADLEKAVLKNANLKLIVEACKTAFDREHQVLAFTPTVNVAKRVCENLKKLSVPAFTVSGAMNTTTRDNTLNSWRTRGGVLLNCAVLTTGFDAPEIRAIVNARPTKRRALFIQMIGRGMRPYPGKHECALYDLGGCVDEFGVIDEVALIPPAPEEPKEVKRRINKKPPKERDPLANIGASEASGKIEIEIERDALLKNVLFSNALELATTKAKIDIINRLAAGISKYSTSYEVGDVNVVFCRQTSSVARKGSSAILREPLPEIVFPVAKFNRTEREFFAYIQTAMFSVAKTSNGSLTPVVVLIGTSEFNDFAYRIYPHAYNRDMLDGAGRTSLSLMLASVCQKLTNRPRKEFLGRHNRFLLAAVLATIIRSDASVTYSKQGDLLIKINADFNSVKRNKFQLEE